ncbi:hypothetical protein BJX61DRAFT_179686 [Aspergillus egyptiacus]|nr:hypothetical protein BJX61DRAFT_179686 [Aspergillus egyptiacus]
MSTLSKASTVRSSGSSSFTERVMKNPLFMAPPPQTDISPQSPRAEATGPVHSWAPSVHGWYAGEAVSHNIRGHDAVDCDAQEELGSNASLETNMGAQHPPADAMESVYSWDGNEDISHNTDGHGAIFHGHEIGDFNAREVVGYDPDLYNPNDPEDCFLPRKRANQLFRAQTFSSRNSTIVDGDPKFDDPVKWFRESLFLDLDDATGKELWDDIFDQPIPKVPRKYLRPRTPVRKLKDWTKLNKLSEEQWNEWLEYDVCKRTPWGRAILKEKAPLRKIEQRKKDKREEKAFHKWYDKISDAIERARRSAEERKEGERLWMGYLHSWPVLDEMVRRVKDAPRGYKYNGAPLKDLLCYPVPSGKRKHLDYINVEKFMSLSPPRYISKEDEEGRAAFRWVLSVEKFRWDPARIFTEYGLLGWDERTMHHVKLTWQIIVSMLEDAERDLQQ